MIAALPFLLGALLFMASGQVTLRVGLRSRPPGLSIGGTLAFALRSPWVWAGSFAQAAAMGLWLLVLQRAEIGLVYPVFIAGGMVLVVASSRLVLGEKVSRRRIIGVVLMLAGILLAWLD